MASESEALFASRYELRRLIGQGRRKRVYRARDTRLDRDVAVALFDADQVAAGKRNVIEWEAQLMSRLSDHPHIVTVFDASWQGDNCYLVTEFMAEGELQEYCQRLWDLGGELELRETIRITDEICQALAYVHERGFIHCDVAPSNIWLDTATRAHLGDFDSTVPLENPIPIEGETDDTTAEYQAPEQNAGQPVDARTDLYSVGGILHYLLTRRAPGPSGTLPELGSTLPEALHDLVRRLLADDPADRPDSAVAVHGALEALRTQEPLQDVAALVAKGEGTGLEFKASMHHVREPKAGPTHGEQQKALRKEVTKTVAAFMNTSGGTLLIGVADDGDVVGIERDVEELGKMATRDKWEQRLKSCLKTALAADAFQHVRISYALHDDKTVALVSVQSRSKETWLMEGQFEEFYVRLANSSEKLTGSSLVSTSASAGPPDPRDSPASSQRHGLPSYG